MRSARNTALRPSVPACPPKLRVFLKEAAREVEANGRDWREALAGVAMGGKPPTHWRARRGCGDFRIRHPDRSFEYVFCDTHKELPETYEYLTRIEACLGQPIERLSSHHRERGFDHYLKLYGDFLPSPKQRWCTRRLKIEPFEHHVGDDSTLLYVGLRADEQRSGYISTKENIRAVFPFKEDGIDKAAVMHILDESGVGLPSYYEWRSRSGCYFCFFQQKGEWVRLRERHPDLFELAKSYEKVEQGYTWAQGESLTDLEKTERREEILRRERERRERLAARRRPRNLAQAFGFSELDDDGEDGCLICHL